MEIHYDSLLKDKLYTERLTNGLTVAVLHKPGYKQVTARVAVQYGSIDGHFVDPADGQEVHVPDGMAHFLEHKLFEDENGNVSDKFSELGAESNAYTTYTHTVYYFTTTHNFEPCLHLLLDLVRNPWFTDENVAKEQGIIEQEIRMYLDDPDWRSSTNLLEALYVAHPVRIDIAGTVESIQCITKEILYLCHRVFYHPSNMTVFVAGDVDPDRVVSLVAHGFAQRPYATQSAVGRILPLEPSHVSERRRSQRLVVNQPLLRLGFKDRVIGLQGRELLEQDLATGMILDAVCGRGSALYTELYEAGLIDQRFGFEYLPEKSFGYSYFSGPTTSPGELEVRLIAGLEAARQRGLSTTDFERVRKKTIGRIVNMMNDLDSIAYLFLDGASKDIHLFDLIPTAMSIRLEAAESRMHSHFDPEAAAVSVIYPK